MRDHLDLDLHLLDRQMVDCDDEPLAKVDDVEFTVDAHGQLRLTALLVGPERLGARLGGRLGQWVGDVGRRLRPDLADPPRVPIEDVASFGEPIRLVRHREDYDFPRSEAWFRQHVIDRLPGSHR
jgi:hypothetical protein